MTNGARLPSSIGPYQVLATLGEGGMGIVYRARDTKLNRDVAIKVLPEVFALDADRLARFTREAQVLASLNHPNIAAIHGLEEQGSIRALVMELVEGEDLSERIARGRIPLDEALPIAKQIAEALEAAHEQGIIHRDLKPANVKVRDDGTVKVLDFGLAKAIDPGAESRQPGADLANSPTMMTAVSMPGMIVGTAAYMSPEQAKGRNVDKRTDVFAFGCVFYEMLTGHRAFPGDDVADILSAVLRLEPDWSRLPEGLPPGVRRLLRLCLEKNVKGRRGSATDVRLDLEQAQADGDGPAPAVATARGSRLAWTVAAALGVVSIAALALAGVGRFGRTPVDVRAARFVIPSPEGWTFANSNSIPRQFAVSPDGTMVALMATASDGAQRLWVREIDSLVARELPGTDGGSSAFWSPDNQWLGFSAGGQLKKIAIAGGSILTLCAVPDFRGGTWNQDDVILFAAGTDDGLLRVSAAGGTPSVVTTLGEGETGHMRPMFLPDGRHFTFFVFGRNASFLASLDSPNGSLLIDNADFAKSANIEYSQGHILFLDGSTLMAQPFDARRLALRGVPVPIATEIKSVNRPSNGMFSASDNGVLVYQTGTSAPESQLTWFDRNGTAIETIEKPGDLGSVALSPDGSRVAFSRRDPTKNEDVWVHEFARKASSRLTFAPGQDWMAVWSPDGSRIHWVSDRRGFDRRDLYQRASSGAGTDEEVLLSPEAKYAYDASLDGRFLAYADLIQTRRGRYQLWFVPVSGADRTPRRYLETDFDNRDARFSPDGRYLAYTSNATGRTEVYVQPFPDAAGGQWIVSQGGAIQPRWRGDGRELFYLSTSGTVMSVEVSTSGAFTPQAPKALFTVQLPRDTFDSVYDVTADGQRFLMNVLPPESSTPKPSPVVVVMHWLPR